MLNIFLGALIGGLGSLIADILLFKTINYSFREEISIMKLVGASNWFVRGPFIVYGILCSLIAGVFALFIFYLLLIDFF